MDTLTTLTTDSNVCLDNDNDAKEPPMQNFKTVECQLERVYQKLAATEANIMLFNTLLRFGLATNDIKNFTVKQTIHKRVERVPDYKVQKVAMISKLKDALAYAKRLRQSRNTLVKRVRKKFSDKKALGRRVLDGLSSSYSRYKKQEYEDVENKIEHYKVKAKLEKVVKVAPDSMSEYLSNVNVF